ncbi:MAG TPA: hypothetical protein VI462_16585 [Acidimicrobiia bacterium]
MGAPRNAQGGRRLARLLGVVVLCSLTAPAAGALAAGPSGPTAAELEAYVAAVEPIRDGVNRLLDTADPLLARWRDHRITGAQAASSMAALEQRFAAYTAQINALEPADPALEQLHVPYAHTYLLEDAYLRALAVALPGGDFAALPHTAGQQRRTIVVWRNQVQALGRARHVSLPRDLAHAGRGDIAPSPTGS